MSGNLDVANTILEQLGGRKFIVMTGAKRFLGGPDSLQFTLSARLTKDGINRARITLDPSDTYIVEFFKITLQGQKVERLHHIEGVYADQLQKIFTSHTGLDTSL